MIELIIKEIKEMIDYTKDWDSRIIGIKKRLNNIDIKLVYLTIEHNKRNYLWEYTGDKRFNYGFIDFKEESLKIKQILGKEVVKRVIKESSRFSQEQLLESKSATFDDLLLDF